MLLHHHQMHYVDLAFRAYLETLLLFVSVLSVSIFEYIFICFHSLFWSRTLQVSVDSCDQFLSISLILIAGVLCLFFNVFRLLKYVLSDEAGHDAVTLHLIDRKGFSLKVLQWYFLFKLFWTKLKVPLRFVTLVVLRYLFQKLSGIYIAVVCLSFVIFNVAHR